MHLFNKTLIIGFGLIGGSFAKAIRQHHVSKEIFAYDLNFAAIELAKNNELIQDGYNNFYFPGNKTPKNKKFLSFNDTKTVSRNDCLNEKIQHKSQRNKANQIKIKDFDLIVIATPLSAYKKIFTKIAGHTAPKTIIIDLGSAKDFISNILPQKLKKNFVACHPIAGSQKSGFENAQSEIFLGKKFVICKNRNSSKNLKKVVTLAQSIGCNIDFMAAKKHDEIYALVSHLPQLLAFLTAGFSPKNIKNEFLQNAFRLDNSDPEIWFDIFVLNKKNLAKFYSEFFQNLQNFYQIKACENWQKNLKELTATFNLKDNLQQIEVEADFLAKNFAVIFFRIIVVASYLQIPNLKKKQIYAGKGFADFISVIAVLNGDAVKLQQLISKNQQKILKLLAFIPEKYHKIAVSRFRNYSKSHL
jgi:prephenate dehydrogenase